MSNVSRYRNLHGVRMLRLANAFCVQMNHLDRVFRANGLPLTERDPERILNT